MKFNLIISNPPYGSIGAEITDYIRQNIRYNEYINLLPANDYRRNKTKDLFNYQTNMININEGFNDALVTTHVACINKTKANNLTAEEFDRSTYTNKHLDKYFLEQSNRVHYAIDNSIYKPALKGFENTDIPSSFYIGKRYIKNKVLSINNGVGYRWNVLMNISIAEALLLSAKSEQALGRAGDFGLIKFNTAEEKLHLSQFLYSDEGQLFFTLLAACINKDSYYNPKYFMPKVDWTKSWTVKEILKEYKYSDKELYNIINDLNDIGEKHNAANRRTKKEN